MRASLLVVFAALLPGSPARAAEIATEGPVQQSAPNDAVFASDGADLQRLVENGPREIWLRPQAYHANLVIKRPLAIRGLRGASIESKTGTLLRIETDDATVDNLVLRGGGNSFVNEDAAI